MAAKEFCFIICRIPFAHRQGQFDEQADGAAGLSAYARKGERSTPLDS
jgi:hypothetical protein